MEDDFFKALEATKDYHRSKFANDKKPAHCTLEATKGHHCSKFANDKKPTHCALIYPVWSDLVRWQLDQLFWNDKINDLIAF